MVILLFMSEVFLEKKKNIYFLLTVSHTSLTIINCRSAEVIH